MCSELNVLPSFTAATAALWTRLPCRGGFSLFVLYRLYIFLVNIRRYFFSALWGCFLPRGSAHTVRHGTASFFFRRALPHSCITKAPEANEIEASTRCCKNKNKTPMRCFEGQILLTWGSWHTDACFDHFTMDGGAGLLPLVTRIKTFVTVNVPLTSEKHQDYR